MLPGVHPRPSTPTARTASTLPHPYPHALLVSTPAPLPPTRPARRSPWHVAQIVGAQLTQLLSLSVLARGEVSGPDGRPVPASELLDGLSALSRLTRLTSLRVMGSSSAGQGGQQGRGASARGVLLALPPGAPLEEVGRS